MNKQILKLSVPNIITNITVPLLGIVDTAILGHLNNINYLNGVTFGALIFNNIYWMFYFLRMGTVGITAQAYGKKDKKESTSTLARSLIVAIFISLVLILLQNPIEFASFYLLNGSAEVESIASEYFYIRIYAAPATIGLYAFTGWFLGMQNAWIPMTISLIINGVNIFLDWLFVSVYHLNAAGVAYGTLIAQYTGLLLSIILFLIFYKKHIKYFNLSSILKLNELKYFFLVNRDIFIRSLVLIVVISVFTAQFARFDKSTFALNSILLQFFFFFSYISDGFANAGEALVGKYMGAKDKINLKKVIRYLFLWGSGIALIFTIIYIVASKEIIGLLTNDTSVIQISSEYIIWAIIIPIASFSAFIWDGIYIGATASKGMRNAMLFAAIFIYLPSFFLINYWGNHGLWFAFVFFLAGRGLFQTILAKKYIGN